MREVTIEQLLVWAYRDQRAGVLGGRAERLGYGRCATQQMIDIGELGDRIAGSGGASAIDLPDDALTVDQFVMRLDGRARRLVVHHAEIGGRPNWFPRGAGQSCPMMDEAGRLRVLRAPWAGAPETQWKWGWAKATAMRDARIKAFEFARRGADGAEVEMGRRLYAEWFDAVRGLWFDLLRDKVLVRHRLRRWDCERAPWLVGSERESSRLCVKGD